MYVHTTRRPDPAVPLLAGFDEEHSHAVAHALQLADPAVLDEPSRPLVLVDDELTTGTTALNTVAALHGRWPRDRYLVATLLDLRTPQVRTAFAARAAELGVSVDVVALLSGSLELPADVLERAVALRAELAAVRPAPVPGGRGRVEVLEGGWPAGVPVGGRTGVVVGRRRRRGRARRPGRAARAPPVRRPGARARHGGADVGAAAAGRPAAR